MKCKDEYKPLEDISIEVKDSGIPLFGIFMVGLGLVIWIVGLMGLLL